MSIDHNAVARAINSYQEALLGVQGNSAPAEAAGRLTLALEALRAALNPAVKCPSQPDDEAEMFRWLDRTAELDWNAEYDKVNVSFPLKSEGFNDLKDAIAQAQANPSDGDSLS